MSETTAEVTPDESAQTATETDWKAEARKWEARAKENAAKVKASEPQLAELEKLKAASQTELERWQSFGKQNEERANKAETDLMRLRVAYDTGLPKELAGRLQGDDEATLREDAKTLLSLVPQDTTPRAPRVDLSQGSSSGSRGNASPGDQFAAILHQQMGR